MAQPKDSLRVKGCMVSSEWMKWIGSETPNRVMCVRATGPEEDGKTGG
jgi:hypothetical protein